MNVFSVATRLSALLVSESMFKVVDHFILQYVLFFALFFFTWNQLFLKMITWFFLCEINFSCLHSRSPSMTSNSNRDSMISNASNSSNVDVPPSLPPKRDMYSNGGADTFSLTNFGDTSSNNSGSQEEIYNLRKKIIGPLCKLFVNL